MSVEAVSSSAELSIACHTEATPACTGRHSRQPSGGKPSSSSEVFDCNICLDTALEPVITMCGHLYCWPCIYRWLQLHQNELSFCPICKADISPERMIPIYGRGQVTIDPRTKDLEKEAIPQRPQGQWGRSRPSPNQIPPIPHSFTTTRRPRAYPPAAQTNVHSNASLSFLPGVLGFQFGQPSLGDDATDQLSPEQVQQAFLSRLLLLLGSFVILCLLLF